MRRFSLYKRNRVYYVRFWDSELKRYVGKKSTGQTDREAALAEVAFWKKYGVPAKKKKLEPLETKLTFDRLLFYIRETPLDTEKANKIITILEDRGLLDNPEDKDNRASKPFLDFLAEFWDWDRSPYVAQKKKFGHSIGKRHCYEQTRRLNHWQAFFSPEVRLCDVTRKMLEEFQLSLKDGLAPKTCNMVLSAGTVALSWAADRTIIKKNPAEHLPKFSGKPEQRGILSEAETQAVFSVEWQDNRSRVGNLVAATSGLRAGEIVALRREDIGTDRLYVRHSWSFADGLKTPKNGETREVPLLPSVRDELLKLADECPYQCQWIFYGPDPDKPMNIDALGRGLHKALIATGWTGEKIQSRNITFHGWRHAYAKRMSGVIDIRTMKLTGHKTAGMLEHYAAHAEETDFQKAAQAAGKVFETVIPFEKPVKAV
jgi:integrase